MKIAAHISCLLCLFSQSFFARTCCFFSKLEKILKIEPQLLVLLVLGKLNVTASVIDPPQGLSPFFFFFVKIVRLFLVFVLSVHMCIFF